jgi:hypothetical protein
VAAGSSPAGRATIELETARGFWPNTCQPSLSPHHLREDMPKPPVPLLQGSLDLLVLGALSWIDYHDNHLGRELKSYQNLQFAHGNTRVQLLPGGNSAYATSEYSLKAKAGERDIDARGLETLVLVKGQDGAWKIRHAHTSSRPARRPPAV